MPSLPYPHAPPPRTRRRAFPRGRTLLVALGLAAALATPPLPAAPPAAASADAKQSVGFVVPVEKYTLANGLEVILHEDHRTPVVAVNVWYHVGSKDESQGKNGFAHLFEHVMFQG